MFDKHDLDIRQFEYFQEWLLNKKFTINLIIKSIMKMKFYQLKSSNITKFKITIFNIKMSDDFIWCLKLFTCLRNNCVLLIFPSVYVFLYKIVIK